MGAGNDPLTTRKHSAALPRLTGYSWGTAELTLCNSARNQTLNDDFAKARKKVHAHPLKPRAYREQNKGRE